MKIEVKAEINEQGKLSKIYGKNKFYRELEQFSGKSVKITIERWRKKRSVSQNAYYWGAMIQYVLDGLIANGYPREGLSPDIVHEYLIGKFLKKSVVSEQTGEVIEVCRRTSELSTVEFMDYIADIQRWSVEFLGVVIPDPNEQATMAL